MPRMSIAQYAKHRGVSDQAVYRAIRAKRVTVRLDDDGKRYIDSEAADKEWFANTDSTQARGDAAKAALEKAASEIISREDDTEGATGEGSEEVEGEEGQERLAAATEVRLGLDSARAKKESYQAELARLKYEEQAGLLVNAEAIREEAFKIARTVRDALLALPDRVSAEFAGELNQFRIHQRLTEEIRKALVSLKGPDDGTA